MAYVNRSKIKENNLYIIQKRIPRDVEISLLKQIKAKIKFNKLQRQTNKKPYFDGKTRILDLVYCYRLKLEA